MFIEAVFYENVAGTDSFALPNYRYIYETTPWLSTLRERIGRLQIHLWDPHSTQLHS